MVLRRGVEGCYRQRFRFLARMAVESLALLPLTIHGPLQLLSPWSARMNCGFVPAHTPQVALSSVRVSYHPAKAVSLLPKTEEQSTSSLENASGVGTLQGHGRLGVSLNGEVRLSKLKLGIASAHGKIPATMIVFISERG
eukprot:5172657-Amphidinium_carterae.1